MLLRRVMENVKAQNWTAVALDFVIVVVGVFIGIQVANWNDARAAKDRKDEIIAALIEDLEDAIVVQEDKIGEEIDAGLDAFAESRLRGDFPPPYYYRHVGSDSAPDTWSMLQQMQIAGLFDPVTLFDLNYYYSELIGVSQKYIRYVTFVETDILPYEGRDPRLFYSEDGALQPEYAASMERLREYRQESRRLSRWARCLIERLKAETRPTKSCLRVDPSINANPYRLPHQAETN